MGKYLNILTHPIFLSLLITAFAIWLMPPLFSKYESGLIAKKYSDDDFSTRYFFHDFDLDGNSETVRQGHNGGSRVPYFCINYNNDRVLDQWNFSGEWIITASVIFGDYNNNGQQEIYGFTWENDSVFLNSIEPMAKPNFILKKKFLFISPLKNNQIPTFIKNGKLVDLDGDNFKEVVFSVNNSFVLQPRAVFAYDVFRDSIYRSPLMGASIQKISFADIDDDGLAEILVNNSANDNYKVPIPYSDTSTWLIVLDNDLTFLFEPIEFKFKYSGNQSFVLRKEGISYIINIHPGESSGSYAAAIYDINGQKIKEQLLNQIKFTGIGYPFFLKDNKIYSVYNSHLVSLDFNLNYRIEKYLDNATPDFDKIDLGNDGIHEFVVTNSDPRKISIYRNDFSHPVTLEITNEDLQPYSVKYTVGKPDQIGINCVKDFYAYEYRENPLYYAKYPIYIGIFMFLYGFFTLLFHFQKKRISKQYETERRLNELQMLTIRNQMNPHFTFNAINSISSVIYKEDKKTAYNFFAKFSDLIRYTLNNAEKIAVPLADEIEFVTNYLDLEKFRFKEKFDFEIQVGDRVDRNVKVPRMILQTFAENAVKHGLSQFEKEGILKIHLSQNDKILKIVVEDNGIGREAASKLGIHGTGKGLRIIDQIFELYQKLRGKRITHNVEDLKDSKNKATGTRVTIELEI